MDPYANFSLILHGFKCINGAPKPNQLNAPKSKKFQKHKFSCGTCKSSPHELMYGITVLPAKQTKAFQIVGPIITNYLE